MRYRPNLAPALRDVSFTVAGGQRVGIVGRTGSGKSSLLQALFRMYDFETTTSAVGTAGGRAATAAPAEEGAGIWIDGLDIRSMPRSLLRQRLAIIPQAPVLFSGTVRSNLLPYGDDDGDDEAAAKGGAGSIPRARVPSRSRDAEVWRVLDECHMGATVRSLPGGRGLDTPLSESIHLSVGERQLLCFARALLKRARLIVLDEATASVDHATDAHIQSLTLALPCTVLLIAHRLSSVMSLDTVLLMDQGRVIECDAPQKLAANTQSQFARLLGQAQAKHGDTGTSA